MARAGNTLHAAIRLAHSDSHTHWSMSPDITASSRGKPLSDKRLGKLFKEPGIAAVPHGFRSNHWSPYVTY